MYHLFCCHRERKDVIVLAVVAVMVMVVAAAVVARGEGLQIKRRQTGRIPTSPVPPHKEYQHHEFLMAV
jgi:hypothetical protein